MPTVKLLSWNVNGLRAVHKKDALNPLLASQQPDILAVQEIKAHVADLPQALKEVDGYHAYFEAAERKGYSGVGTYSRTEPVSVSGGFGVPEFDVEGRVLRTDFNGFTLLNVYFPSGTQGPERVDYKLAFYDAFFDWAEVIRAGGTPLVICGDVNTAHHEIDLARPKQNHNKTSGFLDIERDWITRLLNAGYHDTYRELHPELEQYTWWSARGGARANNIGWRLDYFFVSSELRDAVREAYILTDHMGSDHCPVGLVLAL